MLDYFLSGRSDFLERMSVAWELQSYNKTLEVAGRWVFLTFGQSEARCLPCFQSLC